MSREIFVSQNVTVQQSLEGARGVGNDVRIWQKDFFEFQTNLIKQKKKNFRIMKLKITNKTKYFLNFQYGKNEHRYSKILQN